MSTHTAEATITRPPDVVWAYAADILRHPEWMNVTDARVVHGVVGQPGARGRERLISVIGPAGPASTKATYRGTIRMKGLWRLLAPVVVMEGNSGVRKELQRLKEHVEAAPVAASAE